MKWVKSFKMEQQVFLVCFQNISECDRKKLDRLLASALDIKRILSVVHESQIKEYSKLANGINNAIYATYVNVELEGLTSVRNSFVLGFPFMLCQKMSSHI